MIITKRQINWFLVIWGLFLLGILVLATVFLINKMKNENSLTKAQVENIGRPQIIEQRYYAPTK